MATKLYRGKGAYNNSVRGSTNKVIGDAQSQTNRDSLPVPVPGKEGDKGLKGDPALLIVDTVAELKALSQSEIDRLVSGDYKCIQLNGYYAKDDTPASIEYYYYTGRDSDDGGSVFEVGGIKVKHDFRGVINVLYYGAQTGLTQRILYKTGVDYNITSNLSLNSQNLILPINSNIVFNYKGQLNTGTISLENKGVVKGDHTGTTKIILISSDHELSINNFRTISNLTTSRIDARSSFSIGLNENYNFLTTDSADFAFRFSGENARKVFIDLKGKKVSSSSITKKIMRAWGDPSNDYKNDLDRVIYVKVINGTLDNFNISYDNSEMWINPNALKYQFEDISFQNSNLNIGSILGTKYSEYMFSNCKFINCVPLAGKSLGSNTWGTAVPLPNWDYIKTGLSTYSFISCDFIAGPANNNNNELLHLSDFSMYSNFIVNKCRFLSFDDITTDIIDCYDGSNISITENLFICRVGGTVDGVESAEPTFINVKSHAPSYGQELNNSGYRDESPYAVRRNVVIRGNTFIPLQPNTTANANVCSIIRSNTSLRTDANTYDYTTSRNFTEFSDNFIYFNGITMNQYAIVFSFGGNKNFTASNNKIFIDRKLIDNVTFPSGVVYNMDERTTINTFSFYYGRKQAVVSDVNGLSLDENVFLENNKIYNLSSNTAVRMVYQANSNPSMKNFVIRNNHRFQPNNMANSAWYNANVDLKQITIGGNNFDPLKSFTTTERPPIDLFQIGEYVGYDTKINKAIYKKNSTTWMDAMGVDV